MAQKQFRLRLLTVFSIAVWQLVTLRSKAVVVVPVVTILVQRL
jgi:hypothetical protein